MQGVLLPVLGIPQIDLLECSQKHSNTVLALSCIYAYVSTAALWHTDNPHAGAHMRMYLQKRQISHSWHVHQACRTALHAAYEVHKQPPSLLCFDPYCRPYCSMADAQLLIHPSMIKR